MKVVKSATVRIRRATLDDEPFIRETTARLADFDLPPWRTAEQIVAPDLPPLSEALAHPRETTPIFVAEGEDGERLGFLYLEQRTDYFTNGPHGHVTTLAIAKDAEGRGAAKALMQAAEDWAREHGLPFLTLNVFDRNTRARTLYERLGYAPDTIRYLKEL